MCITLRLAGTHTCASHQTFTQVNQADLKTFLWNYERMCFPSSLTHTPSWQTLGFQDIEQAPCRSELLGRACRTDTHRLLMRTSCWDGGSPWRPDVGFLAGEQRRCASAPRAPRQGGAVCVDHVIEWEEHVGARLTARSWCFYSKRSSMEQWQTKSCCDLRGAGSNPQNLKAHGEKEMKTSKLTSRSHLINSNTTIIILSSVNGDVLLHFNLINSL